MKITIKNFFDLFFVLLKKYSITWIILNDEEFSFRQCAMMQKALYFCHSANQILEFHLKVKK